MKPTIRQALDLLVAVLGELDAVSLRELQARAVERGKSASTMPLGVMPEWAWDQAVQLVGTAHTLRMIMALCEEKA